MGKWLIIISNDMTWGKLAIKFPAAEGRFVKAFLNTFTNLPVAEVKLI